MSLIRQDRLARAWRVADPETRTGFVAGLFEARGYTVDRTDDRHLVLGDENRVLAVDPPETGALPESVDTVVTIDPDPGGDATALGLDAVHEMLCYAIDREVARDLLATHLDVDADREDDQSAERGGESTVESEQTGASGDRQGGDGTSESASADETGKGVRDTATGLVSTIPGARLVDGPLPRGVFAVVGVVVLVVAVVLVGSAGVFTGPTESNPGGPLSTTGTTTPVDVTPLPDQTPQTNPREAGAATPQAEPEPDYGESVAEQRANHPRAPGLLPWGIDDADRMAEAHRTELENSSYTVQIRYQEFVDGQQTGVYTETVRVENQSRYSTTVTTLGDLQTSPRWIAGANVFVSGGDRHVNKEAGVSRIRPDVTPPQILEWTERYLRWSLSVRNSTVRDREAASNVTTFLVTTDGDPFSGVANASGTAYVTENGLVRFGRWSYVRSTHPDIRVVFTVQTTDVGETTVTRPGWVRSE
ncbi:MAG: hypothetical protein ACI8XM_000812 [Haloarculaceae archaeon]|jgi:hypothetical protein